MSSDLIYSITLEFIRTLISNGVEMTIEEAGLLGIEARARNHQIVHCLFGMGHFAKIAPQSTNKV